MPMGAMAARYLKVFKAANPAWFYIHVATQTSAYGVGVAGWATGIKLGSDSTGIEYDTHRNIGIILFAFATLQVYLFYLFHLFLESTQSLQIWLTIMHTMNLVNRCLWN